jgi:hypothetical protein
MPVQVAYPLASAGALADVYQLQAMGINVAGADYPTGIPGALEMVPDPAGQRGTVMRASVRDTDPETSLGHRSEIRAASDTRVEHWYRWQFMLADDWVDDRLFSIMQIHDSPDGLDLPRFPNFLLLAGIGSIDAYLPTATLPTESAAGSRAGSIPLERGRWYDCCLHVVWSISAVGGVREFFIDGRPLVRQFNVATHYDDVNGPYFKLGVYDYFHATGWGSRTAYFTGVQIWRGAASFADGMGQIPRPPQRLLGP